MLNKGIDTKLLAVVTTDVTATSTTFVETGMSIYLSANTSYAIDCLLDVNCDTDGIRFSLEYDGVADRYIDMPVSTNVVLVAVTSVVTTASSFVSIPLLSIAYDTPDRGATGTAGKVPSNVAITTGSKPLSAICRPAINSYPRVLVGIRCLQRDSACPSRSSGLRVQRDPNGVVARGCSTKPKGSNRCPRSSHRTTYGAIKLASHVD
jgi:hypothetical protein